MKQIMNQTAMAIVLAFLAISCASTKKGSSSFDDSPSEYVKEEVQPKPAVKPTPQPAKEVVVREEKVKVIETSPNEKAGKYYVIIGSFKVIENARNFRQQLLAETFLPTILENENGLYRVSIASYDQESQARSRIADIRHTYPKYADVWLLVRKME